MRLLDHIKTSAAVFGWKSVRVQGLANECPIGFPVAFGDFSHGDDFINDARQLVAGFRAVNLRGEYLAIEVVELFVENSYEPDVLAPGVLKVGQLGDHFLTMQAIRTAHVRLSGTVGKCLRLTLRPLEAKATGDRDAVDEDGFIFIERRRVTKLLTDSIKMSLTVDLVFAQ